MSERAQAYKIVESFNFALKSKMGIATDQKRHWIGNSKKVRIYRLGTGLERQIIRDAKKAVEYLKLFVKINKNDKSSVLLLGASLKIFLTFRRRGACVRPDSVCY